MKNKITFYLLLLELVCYKNMAQTNPQPASNINHEKCISKEQYLQIEATEQKNRMVAEANGIKIPAANKLLSIPSLYWPLREANNFKDESLYVVTNFVDRDTSSGILDYNCGSRTYDTHGGMDITLKPFGWLMMDNQVADVIAAAPGIIVGKSDGAFDRNCVMNSANPANYVKVEHADGSQAWYWHLKNGSVTSKPLYSTVNTGDYLGKVGSSGSSTEPHLHFEIHDASGNVVDPNNGSCNSDASLWASQKDYWDSGVLKLMTSINPFNNNTCPNQETTNEINHFIPSGTIKLYTFMRSWQQNQTVDVKLYDEQGGLMYTTSNTNTGASLPFGIFTTQFTFGTSNSGTWKMQVIFNGKIYNHYFTVFCNNYNLNTTHTGNKGFIAEGALPSTSICANTSNVWYEAETEIILNPGFIANQGCTFRTNINDCTVFGSKNAQAYPSENEIGFSFFPNPANDLITVKINNSDSKTVFKIYNSTKQLLKTAVFESGFENIIPTADLSPGIYFIDVLCEKSYKAKFIISR